MTGAEVGPVYRYTPPTTVAEDDHWHEVRARLLAGDRVAAYCDGQLVGWLEPSMPLLWEGDQA